jgi:hypothetical protein
MDVLEPDDVVAAAQFATAALAPHVAADWSVRAGDLEWDVERTVVHFVGAVAKGSLYLASQSTRFIPLSYRAFPNATHEELVLSITPSAQALANVAAATPPEARAFHHTAMQDASGWIAMACQEVLAHTYDACQGLGVPFEAPVDIARRILARTFPWVELDAAPWQVLLWAMGRIELNGRPRTPDGLPGVRGPLALWDGTPPEPRRPDVVEWIRDDGRSWRPIYRS